MEGFYNFGPLERGHLPPAIPLPTPMVMPLGTFKKALTITIHLGMLCPQNKELKKLKDKASHVVY